MRRNRITFVGFERYWMEVAVDGFSKRYGAEFDCRWVLWPSDLVGRLQLIWVTLTSRLVIRMGMPFEFHSETNRAWLALCRLLPWVRPVNYWIGIDVLHFLKRRAAGEITQTDMRAVRQLHHITVTEHLAAELRLAGVKARNAELMGVDRDISGVALWPERFRVLGYWSAGTFEHIGGPAFYEAARALPDVEFLVLGTDGSTSPPAPGNVRFLGRLDDPVPVYEKCVVLVRMIEHDAVPSGMIEEMLLLGRYVIYTYPWPHTITVRYRDAVALVRELTALRESFEDGTLPLNAAGREFTVLDSNPDAQADSMRSAFLEILAERR